MWLTFVKVWSERGPSEGPEEVETHDGHPAEHGEAGQVKKVAQDFAAQRAYPHPVVLNKRVLLKKFKAYKIAAANPTKVVQF